MNKVLIKSIIPVVMLMPGLIMGAEAAVPAKQESSLDIHLILEIMAIVMLLPLFLTTKTFILSITDFNKKRQEALNKVKNSSLLIFFSLIAFSGFAQTSEATAPKGVLPAESITWILASVVVLEALLVIFFSWQTYRLLKMPLIPVARKAEIKVYKKSKLRLYWEKVNNFNPEAGEESLDTGHSYDGIRELDNITPPWFTTAFMLSIVFAVVYLWRYHISESAPLQIEEFNTEMAEAEAEKARYLATQANNVDENTVSLLEGADIAKGQAIFAQKCAACHGSSGGSMPGGVGPNLTDAYWLHGGSLKEVFKSIKYGWPEKGMIAWQEQLSPVQIAQIASYIHSIQGSNPAGAKEAQGDLYTPVKDSTQTVTKDSL